MTLLYFYCLEISNKDTIKKNRIKKFYIIFDVVVTILMTFSPLFLELNINNKTSNAYGLAIDILYLV